MVNCRLNRLNIIIIIIIITIIIIIIILIIIIIIFFQLYKYVHNLQEYLRLDNIKNYITHKNTITASITISQIHSLPLRSDR